MERADILEDIEDAFGVVIPQGAEFVTVGGLCEFVQHALDEGVGDGADSLTSAAIHERCLGLATRHAPPASGLLSPDSDIRETFRWRFRRARLLLDLERDFRVSLRPPTPPVSAGMVFFFIVAVELLVLVVMGGRLRRAEFTEVIFLMAIAAGIGAVAVQAMNRLAGGVLPDLPPAVRTVGELTFLVRNALVKAGRARPNDTAVTWGVRAVLGAYTSLPMADITRDKRLAEDLHLS